MKELQFTIRKATKEELERSTIERPYISKNYYLIKTNNNNESIEFVISDIIRMCTILKAVKEEFNLL